MERIKLCDRFGAERDSVLFVVELEIQLLLDSKSSQKTEKRHIYEKL